MEMSRINWEGFKGDVTTRKQIEDSILKHHSTEAQHCFIYNGKSCWAIEACFKCKGRKHFKFKRRARKEIKMLSGETKTVTKREYFLPEYNNIKVCSSCGQTLAAVSSGYDF